MRQRVQVPDEIRQHVKPTRVVGMDAHTRKLALCLSDWYYGSDPIVAQRYPYVSIDELETVYQRHIPKDALTLIEASGNTFAIKERLERIGYKVFVLRSDILQSIQKKDKITDLSDAEKLCFAYARGNARDEVWSASPKFREYRDLLSARKRAVCDATRISNRLFGYCNNHGHAQPRRRHEQKLEDVKSLYEQKGITSVGKTILKSLHDDYKHALATRDLFEKKILGTVVKNKDMLRLMQLPGVGAIIAFAIVAFVEDIHRFETPKKLVAYFGINPSVSGSGEEEERNKQKYKEHGHLSEFGRSDLKAFCSEIGQTVLRRDDFELAKWGRRLLARGKLYNKVVMAVARKVITYAWHMLMGHETPSRESEALFKRKLCILYRKYGKERMQKLGYERNSFFVSAIAEPLYAHLAESSGELQTAASPASAL